MRPKGRGRPQRILLGSWPEEHVRLVIRAVVFRDGTIPPPPLLPPMPPVQPAHSSANSLRYSILGLETLQNWNSDIRVYCYYLKFYQITYFVSLYWSKSTE